MRGEGYEIIYIFATPPPFMRLRDCYTVAPLNLASHDVSSSCLRQHGGCEMPTSWNFTWIYHTSATGRVYTIVRQIEWCYSGNFIGGKCKYSICLGSHEE